MNLMNVGNNSKGILKIYIFLKDCAVRSVFKAFQSGQLSEQEK